MIINWLSVEMKYRYFIFVFDQLIVMGGLILIISLRWYVNQSMVEGDILVYKQIIRIIVVINI